MCERASMLVSIVRPLNRRRAAMASHAKTPAPGVRGFFADRDE